MNILKWSDSDLFTFFFTFIRVNSILIFLPILGDRSVPAVVKILFSLSLSFVLFPIILSNNIHISPDVLASSSKMVLAIITNILVGLAIGYASKWIFDAINFSGFFSGLSMGFSIATVLNSHSESQSLALSELHYGLAALLFLSLDGIHIYLQAILESFKYISLDASLVLMNMQKISHEFIRISVEVFILALKLSAPVIIVILLVNVMFGIMARAVPQMNVFVVSFTVNIVIGLFTVIVCLPGWLNMVNLAFDSYTPSLFNFIKIIGGH